MSNVEVTTSRDEECEIDLSGIESSPSKRKRKRSIYTTDYNDLEEVNQITEGHESSQRAAFAKLPPQMSIKIFEPHLEKNRVTWIPHAASFKLPGRIRKLPCDVSMISSFLSYDDISNVSNSLTAKISHRSQVQTCFIPLAFPIPRSQTWIAINENIRSEDEPVLRYVPYFGDDDVTGVDVSAYEQVPGEIEHEICSEPDEVLILYFLHRHSLSKISDDDLSTLPSVRPEVLTSLERILRISTSQLFKAFNRAFEGRLLRERSRENIYNKTSGYHACMAGGQNLLALQGCGYISYRNSDQSNSILGLKGVDNYESLVESYRELFCRRCYVYDCQAHGVMQPKPNRRTDPQLPFPSPIPGIKIPGEFARDVISNAPGRPRKLSPAEVSNLQHPGQDISVIDGIPVKLYSPWPSAGASKALPVKMKKVVPSATSLPPVTEVEKALLEKAFDVWGTDPQSMSVSYIPS